MSDDELERECLEAAGGREPVLLVGDEASRPQLERVARRIHDLSNPTGGRYRSISCFGLPPDRVTEASDVVFGIRHLSTIHLGDVESACPALAWVVTHEALDSHGIHARLIASTTKSPEQWPQDNLMCDRLRRCQRIVLHSTETSAIGKKEDEPGSDAPTVGWGDVTITFKSRDTAIVTCRNAVIARGSYETLGFADRRTEAKPVRSWNLLLLLATQGEISWKALTSHQTGTHVSTQHLDLSKVVQDFRKRLRHLAKLKDDPLTYSRDEKLWRAKFVVRDRTHDGAGGGLVDASDYATDEDEKTRDIREFQRDQMDRGVKDE
jgi:hypothetical protein